MLHVQMPLLHVGPNNRVGNGIEAVRKRWCNSTTAAAADAGIANDVALRRRLQQRGGLAFDAFRVRFVSIGVFEENAIPASNCRFAITAWVPGKSNSRSRIEEMSLRAA